MKIKKDRVLIFRACSIWVIAWIIIERWIKSEYFIQISIDTYALCLFNDKSKEKTNFCIKKRGRNSETTKLHSKGFSNSDEL